MLFTLTLFNNLLSKRSRAMCALAQSPCVQLPKTDRLVFMLATISPSLATNWPLDHLRSGNLRSNFDLDLKESSSTYTNLDASRRQKHNGVYNVALFLVQE